MEKITYIRHDCFLIETETLNIITDFWQSPDPSDPNPPQLDRLDASKPLLVLVSHSHKDHYNPQIFSWAARFERICYVVSKDVWQRMRHVVSPDSVYNGPKIRPDQAVCLRRGGSCRIFGASVSACGSTDIGNSYLIETSDGVTLFHAGDLNAWIWLDESTEQEVAKAMGDFNACLREIDRTVGNRTVDYAFFPVDSRIGREYWRGAKLFLRALNVAHFFPMHFALGNETEQAQRAADALRFDEYANQERGEYIALTVPGQPFLKA